MLEIDSFIIIFSCGCDLPASYYSRKGHSHGTFIATTLFLKITRAKYLCFNLQLLLSRHFMQRLSKGSILKWLAFSLNGKMQWYFYGSLFLGMISLLKPKRYRKVGKKSSVYHLNSHQHIFKTMSLQTYSCIWFLTN